jgi:hypothetical protein
VDGAPENAPLVFAATAHVPPLPIPAITIMNLSRSQIPAIAKAIVTALVDNQLIEVSNRHDAAVDLEAVLETYVDQEREVAEHARDLVQARGLPTGEYGRIRRIAAEQRGIKVGDDALDFMLDQLVEMLMHSSHVDEVFAQDHELRRAMRTFIVDSAQEDQKLEAEVRGKLKHVVEGSRMWDIEYRRMKEDIKRRRGL